MDNLGTWILGLAVLAFLASFVWRRRRTTLISFAVVALVISVVLGSPGAILKMLQFPATTAATEYGPLIGAIVGVAVGVALIVAARFAPAWFPRLPAARTLLKLGGAGVVAASLVALAVGVFGAPGSGNTPVASSKELPATPSPTESPQAEPAASAPSASPTPAAPLKVGEAALLQILDWDERPATLWAVPITNPPGNTWARNVELELEVKDTSGDLAWVAPAASIPNIPPGATVYATPVAHWATITGDWLTSIDGAEFDVASVGFAEPAPRVTPEIRAVQWSPDGAPLSEPVSARLAPAGQDASGWLESLYTVTGAAQAEGDPGDQYRTTVQVLLLDGVGRVVGGYALQGPELAGGDLAELEVAQWLGQKAARSRALVRAQIQLHQEAVSNDAS